MHRIILGFLLFVVDSSRSAVFCFIGGKHLLPAALARNAYAVVFTLDRYEVADDDNFIALIIYSSERDNALEIVIVADPGEAVPVVVMLPEGGFSR